MASEQLALTLTHILNNCISKFPSAWNIARISAIPKTKEWKSNNDLRPTSILPVLSKVYKRLVVCQTTDFPSQHGILKDTLSAHRKGHNTTSLPLAMRDDIIKAMIEAGRGYCGCPSRLFKGIRHSLV